MSSKFSSYIENWSSTAVDLLCKLINIESTNGNEREVQEYLADYVKKLGFDPELIPIQPNIELDEDYTTVPGHKGYDGRSNIVMKIQGTGGGKSIILNSHVDVVPAGDEMFDSVVENGIVRGRGACDAKGHVVTILLALKALKEAGIRLKGDVITQFVIEEEAGGNGTLSVIMDGYKADGVVVFESTDFRVFCANRGALWFKLGIEGKATHMGRWREGVSALDEMMDVINHLNEYERTLVAESGGDPLFPDVEGNVKLNIGVINGGDWPSMVPDHCAIEGGIGFLPNKRLADLRNDLRQVIETKASEWTRNHYTLVYERLHNEAYRMPPDHPLAEVLLSSAKSVGVESEVTGWTASCDARLFWHRGQMPTVVFGPGSVSHAHSPMEQICIDDIKTGALVLAEFLVNWCGTQSEP